jgi:hypothetical protein
MQRLQYWRRMLLLAFSCRHLLYQPNKTIIFFRPKREKKKRRRKKRYASLKAMQRRLSRFFGKKYYLQGGDFFSKTRRA